MRAAYGSRLQPASRECAICGELFVATRIGHVACSDRCRQRKCRSRISDADRAAIRRVFERDGYGCPLPPVSRERLEAHVLATAVRT